MQTKKTAFKETEAGFTLLEIIAVLVILSILAVVAVPKYFDLQTQAKERALDSAVAEGISRVNSYFARQILGGSTPGEITYTTAQLDADMGDFTLQVTDGGGANTTTPIEITVTGASTAVLNMQRIFTVRRPGTP